MALVTFSFAYPIIGCSFCLSLIFSPFVGAEDTMTQQAKIDSTQVENTAHISSFSNCLKGNGKAVVQTRFPQDFSNIKIDGVFTVIIELQQQRTLTVKGDENLLPHVVTTVEDHTLLVSIQGSLCPEISPEIRITNDYLARLSAGGVTDIRVANLENKTFTVHLDGSSDLNLSGTSEKFTSLLEGSNRLLAGELQTQDTTVTIDGAGKALVNASRKLVAEIHGAGDILYTGNPLILDQRIYGAGHIEPYKGLAQK